MSETAGPDGAELVELLRKSLSQSAVLIASTGPGQLADPTPCSQFDVEELMGHMHFAAERVARAGRRLPLGEDAETAPTPPAGELPAAFEKAAADTLEAWSAPEAMEGEIVLPFGTFPAAVVAQIYVIEQATHAWDLAVATGARGVLDEELATAVLPIATVSIRPEYRGGEPMPFAAAVEVPPGAPAYDRLAGFMGRRPEWAG